MKKHFFKINILIDIVAIFIIVIWYIYCLCNTNKPDFYLYLIYSPVFFLLRLLFMLFQLFRYKIIRVWKTIIYCILLLLVSCFLWSAIFFMPVLGHWIFET
jgi:hypothetical protein